jgi:hypothetical protein
MKTHKLGFKGWSVLCDGEYPLRKWQANYRWKCDGEYPLRKWQANYRWKFVTCKNCLRLKKGVLKK